MSEQVTMVEVDVTEDEAKPKKAERMKEGERKVILHGGFHPNSTGHYTLCTEVGTGNAGIFNIQSKHPKALAAAEAMMDVANKFMRVRCINDEGVCFLRNK